MDKGKESTFLLFTWSILFVFLPLQIPIFEWKNGALLPFWQGILRGLFNKDLPLFSDSEGFWIVTTFLLVLSAGLFGIMRSILKENTIYIHGYLRSFLLICLFIIFAKYGLDKWMMAQFPPPEPNILLTEVVNLDKDILFWTTMGTSRLFNYITGAVEIIGALFLLFHRTRRLGLMTLLISALFILLLNFSFNIGVKLFSLILVGTLLSLNWNSLNFILTYFLGFGEEKNRTKDKRIYLPILKVILAGSLLLFFYETNTENKIENPLMGAYQNVSEDNLSRVYINQQDYWIEETKSGEYESFKIIHSGEKALVLEDENEERTEIQFYASGDRFTLLKAHTKHAFHKIDLSKTVGYSNDFQLIIR